MILQIENVYPAGVMFNSYLRDKFPTLLLKMSEAGKRNNGAYSMFTYFFKKCKLTSGSGKSVEGYCDDERKPDAQNA